MKKKILILLIILSMFVITGCKSEEKDSDTSNNDIKCARNEVLRGKKCYNTDLIKEKIEKAAKLYFESYNSENVEVKELMKKGFLDYKDNNDENGKIICEGSIYKGEKLEFKINCSD